MPSGGRKFTRFAQVNDFIDSVIVSPWWESMFPDAPIEVTVMRRSRGATFSAATVDVAGEAGAIWIRDGSWDLVTVLHELAHVAAERDDPTGPHGSAFVDALGELWRHYLGFHAFGALQSALEAHGVPLRRERRPPTSDTV